MITEVVGVREIWHFKLSETAAAFEISFEAFVRLLGVRVFDPLTDNLYFRMPQAFSR